MTLHHAAGSARGSLESVICRIKPESWEHQPQNHGITTTTPVAYAITRYQYCYLVVDMILTIPTKNGVHVRGNLAGIHDRVETAYAAHTESG